MPPSYHMHQHCIDLPSMSSVLSHGQLPMMYSLCGTAHASVATTTSPAGPAGASLKAELLPSTTVLLLLEDPAYAMQSARVDL